MSPSVPKPGVQPKSKKVKRFSEKRDPKYAAFIRTLPCALKGHPEHYCAGNVQACHLKSRGAGGDDYANLFPACLAGHKEQHDVGIRYFAQEYFGGMLALKKYVTETLPKQYGETGVPRPQENG